MIMWDPEGTTEASLTLRVVAGSRSEPPTLRAHVSFVGGADGVLAPQRRRREGHAVVWVSLLRDPIDPRGVAPFNGTRQKRWERAALISGRKKKHTLFIFLHRRTSLRRRRCVWLIARRSLGRSNRETAAATRRHLSSGRRPCTRFWTL